MAATSRVQTISSLLRLSCTNPTGNIKFFRRYFLYTIDIYIYIYIYTKKKAYSKAGLIKSNFCRILTFIEILDFGINLVISMRIGTEVVFLKTEMNKTFIFF